MIQDDLQGKTVSSKCQPGVYLQVPGVCLGFPLNARQTYQKLTVTRYGLPILTLASFWKVPMFGKPTI